MPIYEYKCGLCGEDFEVITLKIEDSLTSPCPHCNGEGKKLISAPAIVYEVFDERRIDKLPDWNQKMKQAQRQDVRTRQHLSKQPPLEHDRGQGIKVRNIPFGTTERKRLESNAQLDNI